MCRSPCGWLSCSAGLIGAVSQVSKRELCLLPCALPWLAQLLSWVDWSSEPSFEEQIEQGKRTQISAAIYIYIYIYAYYVHIVIIKYVRPKGSGLSVVLHEQISPQQVFHLIAM